MSDQARPLLSIPCPLSPSFNASWRDEFKAKGGEYWWYVCLAPDDPHANLFIFQAGPQHRALFWQTWANKVDGLLYWGLNFWSGYEYNWPNEAKNQTQRIEDERFNIGGVKSYPGDGFSMYPGPTPGQPTSSIRLESMRDGEEDYEYFVLLDKLLAKAKQEGRTGAAIEKALDAENAARKLVADMTKYERSAEPYFLIREKIADAIEALSNP
jgi:hypothetical protein